MKKRRITRIILTIVPLVGLCVLIYFLWYMHRLGNQAAVMVQNFLKQMGPWAPIGFIIFQLIQVIVPILPGGLSVLVGTLLFGNIPGIIYSYIGGVIGEMIGFELVRKLGNGLLPYIFSPQTYAKYERIATEQSHNMEKLLIITLIVPFMPDDVACLVSGLSKMKFSRYCAIILILKPWSIALYSYFLLFVFHRIF